MITEFGISRRELAVGMAIKLYKSVKDLAKELDVPATVVARVAIDMAMTKILKEKELGSDGWEKIKDRILDEAMRTSSSKWRKAGRMKDEQ